MLKLILVAAAAAFGLSEDTYGPISNNYRTHIAELECARCQEAKLDAIYTIVPSASNNIQKQIFKEFVQDYREDVVLKTFKTPKPVKGPKKAKTDHYHSNQQAASDKLMEKVLSKYDHSALDDRYGNGFMMEIFANGTTEFWQNIFKEEEY